ncbi:MAG TPA: pilus assembly PilX N-terminal domain-containing protein [Patescibacteria group bacterium]|nr:pilus assembly PilX N-terminal domain-containing protein [Patescibacteria group bacterium]
MIMIGSSKFMKMRKKENGSALVYALVIMTVVLIVLVSMISYVVGQLKFSYNRAEKEKAFQTAEAGVYYYRWYLAHQTSGKTPQQIQDFWTGGEAIGVGSTFVQNYEGIGQFNLSVTPPSAGSTIVTVTSEGYTFKEPEIKRTVKVRFRRPSWSEYIFLSNSFINFGDQSEVWGKVHSNFGIRFDGIAHNTVSALPAKFNDPSHSGCNEFGVHTHRGTNDPCAPSNNPPWPANTVPNRPDVFMGGREFPVPEISFSGVTADLSNMKAQAQAGNGRYFNKDANGDGVDDYGRHIILKNDGTYDICTVIKANNSHDIANSKGYQKNSGTGTCDSCSGQCLSNHSIVNDGVIFVENHVWVEGSINNKRLSIVAANLSGGGDKKDIYIGISNDNLRYSSYNCDNMLGLVAQRDVRVLNNCPSNFTVDAALLAQTGLVGIVTGMGGKYSLTFNGAIASYLQPYFQDGGSGFADRHYNFNNDLLYCPPPYFPTGNEYAIDLWEEL